MAVEICQFTMPTAVFRNLSSCGCVLSGSQEYQQVVDAEWRILYDKLDKIVASGAKVVLSKLPIGDVATQYFADRHVSLYVGLCTWQDTFYIWKISRAR